MKVGRSLSFCVRDIALGRVKYDEVEYVICGTAFKDLDAFTRVIVSYSQTYWRDDKAHAMWVALKLYNEGKLLQPRLQGGNAPSVAVSHWMEAR